MVARWPIEERTLDDLDLDLRNVRIPGGDLDESAIVNYLVEAADLLDLMRGILRDGYIDNELPVVLDENGRLIVLEGNRRIASLKAIQRPSLLGKAAAKVERLVSRHPNADTPTEIRVMVAPSREAAQPLLARLHTRNPKKPWIREQQAIFYHAQLAPGMTIDALRALYPGEQGSVITSYIRMGEMREVVRNLRYDDPDLEEWVKSGKLTITSLEYAYDLPKIQDALDLRFDKNGRLASKRMTEGQRQALIYLLMRIRAKTLNTRSPELLAKREEHAEFAGHLRLIVTGAADGATSDPDVDAAKGNGVGSSGQPAAGTSTATGSAPGGGTPLSSDAAAQGAIPRDGAGPGPAATTVGESAGNAGTSGGVAGSGSDSKPASRGPNRGDTRSRLNMDGFEYGGSKGAMRRRFEELHRLDVQIFPNAAHDLLRTVLECSIKEYFAVRVQPPATQSPLKGKQLGACVESLAKEFQSDRRMTALIDAINRKGRLPAAQFAGTEFSLNAGNHEPDYLVAGKDVHEAWDKIKPILIEIVGK
ncbi:hypothetical protein ACG83_10295 [Frankia sp. R43]|uniref:hypothetical protein n=1 Tax=Frankia sp. R43 TaxID=269536 RepID=UPI0006CA3E9E|nr:hypothetical protein [Frankia sp. R43]KPM55670.1 hypothetical protein ACG83_10295 [Frankia sp. R43]